MSNFCLENRFFLNCLKKSKFFENLPEKNRNFSKFAWKNPKFFDPDPRPPRFQTRLTPLALPHSRFFTSIGPNLWNALSPSVCLLYVSYRQSFVFLCLSQNLFFSPLLFSKPFFSWGLAHWQRF